MGPFGALRGTKKGTAEQLIESKKAACQFESGKQGQVSLRQSISMKTSQIIKSGRRRMTDASEPRI